VVRGPGGVPVERRAGLRRSGKGIIQDFAGSTAPADGNAIDRSDGKVVIIGRIVVDKAQVVDDDL